MGKIVSFERRLTASYMVITSETPGKFDEKVLLKRKIDGLLPVEKCYVDGKDQYWYCISGKQSLDTYCRIHSVGLDFMEKLIVSLCAQVEIVGRNMISTNSILLDPGQIYVSNVNGEIIFAVCPGEQTQLNDEFRKLMEYLLTRLDHSDAAAVQMAYRLYEKTLEEHYSITDLRDSIAEARALRVQEEIAVEPISANAGEERPETPVPAHDTLPQDVSSPVEQELGAIFNRIKEIWGNWRSEFRKRRTRKSKEETKAKMVYYPEDEEGGLESAPPQQEAPLHPTICLSDRREHPDGILLYEGYEGYADIDIAGRTVCIGKGKMADVRIEKETVSHLHARIVYEEEEYYIEDLNSTNGTSVNDSLLPYREKRKLASNDIIKFADVKYRFL